MNKEQVRENAIKYFNGDDLAANVWLDKYCLKDKNEYLETDPDQTIVRLATELARIEKNYPNPVTYDTIYGLMKGYNKFVLGGSPLFGVGNNTTLSTLGSCFVINSPEDSYGGIFRADQELAQLMKRRGGVGIDISSLRPKRAFVNNAASSSTGAVSFMERYSNTTREVAQEGRRGALMITMDIDHSDIEDFITAKNDLTKITGANISVKITDKFMMNIFYDTKCDRIWKKLIHQAWKTAEPGVLFWDKIIKESPADCYPDFKTISTNPCSELPLCAYDSCRLSAINIYAYIEKPFTNKAYFKQEEFERDVIIYQRLMDDLVDLEIEKVKAIISKIISDPEDISIKKVELDVWKKILDKLTKGRRTGLGQMGLADAGAALSMKYGSSDFCQFAEQVNKILSIESYRSSIIMAKERGAFPIWNLEKEVYHPYVKRILCAARGIGRNYIDYGRRNIANLTIAPTGSISLLAQVSSGIEPVFDISYKRKRKVTADDENKTFQDKQGDWWEEYKVYHPKWELRNKILDVDHDHSLLLSDPYWKATAHDIDPYTKLTLQSMIQPWIDHSISVTYNLPTETTEEEVSNLYMKAWELGLKGMTVYREGSRDGVLTTKPKIEFKQHDAPKRPKTLPHDVYSVMSKGHHWMVSVGILEGKAYEVFAFNNVEISGTRFVGEMTKLSKGRYDLHIPSNDRTFQNVTNGCSDEENLLTRMISTSLRHGADIKFVVEQLNKSEGDITSFGKAIARILRKYIPEDKIKEPCPECGGTIINEGGCNICKDCGYSRCN